MARIRYLSILSHAPARLASFYTQHLGLRRLGESPDGDISLSDGGYNLTLFSLLFVASGHFQHLERVGG